MEAMDSATDNRFSRFFNLDASPFGETPDPRYYVELPGHHRVLSKLHWAIHQGKAFTLVTGDAGTGKTLLSRILAQGLGESCHTALLLYPVPDERDLVQTIADEFEFEGFKAGASLKEQLKLLYENLIAQAKAGKRCVLLVDEAQGFPGRTLESIRYLSNLETENRKLLQVILFGQSDLRERLATPSLKHIEQRISVQMGLPPLSAEDTKTYIQQRLEIARVSNSVRFADSCFQLIHSGTSGIPQKINRICEETLLAADIARVRLIQPSLVRPLFQASDGRAAKSWIKRLLTGRSAA